MTIQISREVLHRLVLAESRTLLARRLEVSSTGKVVCQSGHTDVIPQLLVTARAGKRVVQAPLPLRGLGQADMVLIGSSDYGAAGWGAGHRNTARACL